MRRSYYNILFVLLLSALVFGCDKTNCKEEKYTSAIVSEFPDSLKVGVTHNVVVDYVIENSCGQFVDFEVNQADTYTEIKVKMLYEGCNCTLEFGQAEALFPINYSVPGNYKYRFWISETEYDSYTLSVYE